MDHTAFLSYSHEDAAISSALREALEQFGIRVWMDRADVLPGQNWGDAISAALLESQAVVLILSRSSTSSERVMSELSLADAHRIPIIPYRIEHGELPPRMDSLLGRFVWIDGTDGNTSEHAEVLAESIRRILPEQIELTPREPQPELEIKSLGYVFISYIRTDSDFVEKLRRLLESKKYAYWDYVVGERDYHGALYRELEERIDGAAAFMTIVSDEWRNSDWVASEFIYAREAGIPIFVIEAKQLERPLPILLNLQTRIDMSQDLETGVQVLIQELAKKGL